MLLLLTFFLFQDIKPTLLHSSISNAKKNKWNLITLIDICNSHYMSCLCLICFYVFRFFCTFATANSLLLYCRSQAFFCCSCGILNLCTTVHIRYNARFVLWTFTTEIMKQRKNIIFHKYLLQEQPLYLNACTEKMWKRCGNNIVWVYHRCSWSFYHRYFHWYEQIVFNHR